MKKKSLLNKRNLTSANAQKPRKAHTELTNTKNNNKNTFLAKVMKPKTR